MNTREEANELYWAVFHMVDRVHGGEKAGKIATTLERVYFAMVEHNCEFHTEPVSV